MTRFECDYTQGAHPRILQRLLETNMDQTSGYGTDEYCERARDLIRRECEADAADVHFLVGGTQTNTTVIAALLRPHQGVLSADTGHIAGHETGAIEAAGHKVLTLPHQDGKITAEQVRRAYEAHENDGAKEHTVQPGMVYISQSTENGTVYTLSELEALSEACRECGLPLFVDGARLGYALAAEGGDVTLADLARLTDVFYIGGTKLGALMGEAVVILNEALKRDFRYLIKQRGGLLAKGRLLGVQFETFFEDGLYFEISRHAVSLAMKLRRGLEELGFGFLHDSPTNQQFPILPDDLLEGLKAKHSFTIWEKVDATHTAVRFCTSWGTTETEVDGLLGDLAALRHAAAGLNGSAV
ncbi:threonine aldolase family protein [Saccharibacillus alkalitolerans]|uniref:Aminotransferase class I/II-fold pyridoxal phosphate-dependent enzyme n=1 Tax=Saccharibacillus alkalitolerans TaxID=2705290 RepID=A0ABX0F7W1_9BACL|nr:aminotransferase class I/II-fold pyridoxal phosphate-dependent enzyme [Saccharibacillus alkalitolerans]NGZ76480.1 aminotransferase class I/II-fold pyridoxal phosphate-dependent enzyme [Saccharibacillus alkalitolerans]